MASIVVSHEFIFQISIQSDKPFFPQVSSKFCDRQTNKHYMESSRKRGSQSREENLIVSWGVVDSLVVVVDNLVGVFDSFVGVVDSIMGVFDTINYPHETINYPHKTINNPHYTIKYPYKTINYPHKTINYPHETIKYPMKLSTTPHETIKFSSCDYLPCLRELSNYFFILLFQKKKLFNVFFVKYDWSV